MVASRNSKLQFSHMGRDFLNITNESWTGNRTFERNRAFIGTRSKLNELSYEIGYMNQYVPRKELSTMEHILTLYLFF